MRKLGATERAVMEILWEHPGGASAREVTIGLPQELAMTTVLTVLDRLRRKGLVRREPAGRRFRYLAAAGKADYVSALMVEALGTEADSHVVLERFVQAVSPEQVEALRRLLDDPPEAD